MPNNSSDLTAGKNLSDDNEDNVATLETGFDGDDSLIVLVPDDPTTLEFQKAICLKGDKIAHLSVVDDNPFIRSMAAIADSSDMQEAQFCIYGYERGFKPLYRTLDRIINLANDIDNADNQVLLEAFCKLKADCDAKKGFRNIGRPKLPKIDDAYVVKLKEDPCRKLIDFYFPGADGAIRSRYTTVTTWAKKHNKTGFVDWLDNDISCDGGEGLVNCGSGIKGAIKFLGIINQDKKPALVSQVTPIDLAKQVGKDTRVEVVKPSWLDKDAKDFLVFASVEGGKLFLYDLIDTNKRSIEAVVKLKHASEYASAYDYSASLSDLVMDNIQSLRKLITPAEFIMWQDKFQTYIMPLYATWVDNNENVVKRCTNSHYAVMVEIGQIIEHESDFDAAFPEVFEQHYPDAVPNVFDIGYSTKEIDKIGRFKGTLDIDWAGSNLIAYHFMGAYWETTANRKWKRGKSDSDGLMRYLSEPPVGHEYLLMTAHGSPIALAGRVDFDNARKEFKRWKDLRLNQNIKDDTDILIAIENGIIGVWFSPIKTTKQPKKGETQQPYVYDGVFVEVGKTNHKDFRGKWLIPEKRMERIWNYVSHYWDIVIPEPLNELVVNQGTDAREVLDYDEAEEVMKGFVNRTQVGDERLNDHERKDKHYTRLPDLCSDQEVGYDYVKDGDRYRRAAAGEVGKRMCIPLVMKCGRMWVHLPSVNG